MLKLIKTIVAPIIVIMPVLSYADAGTASLGALSDLFYISVLFPGILAVLLLGLSVILYKKNKVRRWLVILIFTFGLFSTGVTVFYTYALFCKYC